MSVTDSGELIGWIKFWKPKDAWYNLGRSEREKYFLRYRELTGKIVKDGARLVGTYKCRGQSAWERFEVWEFPDLQTLVSFTDGLEEINHFLYFSSDHIFGRKYEQILNPDSWVV